MEVDAWKTLKEGEEDLELWREYDLEAKAAQKRLDD
jgi:hypothetical protein